jgi:hypothetical protein
MTFSERIKQSDRYHNGLIAFTFIAIVFLALGALTFGHISKTNSVYIGLALLLSSVLAIVSYCQWIMIQDLLKRDVENAASNVSEILCKKFSIKPHGDK